MQFKRRNLRALGSMLVGDEEHFLYRSSSHITEFFADCGLDFVHDGSTRAAWAADRLADLLRETSSTPNALPDRMMGVLQALMDLADADDGDPGRTLALEKLNAPLRREGFDGFYDSEGMLQVRHIRSRVLSVVPNPHRPLTERESATRREVLAFIAGASEDELTQEVLLPLFRQLGFQRITFAGHHDKALEYGKDVWMRYVLPTQHVLYFGLQVKKGKLNSAGVTRGSDTNIAEIHNQVLMMLGHEVFDPEVNRRVLVDHAIIVAGGEITKQAKNWLGEKLDATRRSQILFMDGEDIANLVATAGVELPKDGSGEPCPSSEAPF